MKDLFIETGDVENSVSIFPNNDNFQPLPHNRDGLVTLLLNDDGSVSPRFAITMQPLRVFDENHLVIGKVVEGVNLITDLDAHGTQFGIPERMFFITVTAVRQ
jgi:cyclophilin family peptidyl-prolyl cis-trans isomerase